MLNLVLQMVLVRLVQNLPKTEVKRLSFAENRRLVKLERKQARRGNHSIYWGDSIW